MLFLNKYDFPQFLEIIHLKKNCCAIGGGKSVQTVSRFHWFFNFNGFPMPIWLIMVFKEASGPQIAHQTQTQLKLLQYDPAETAEIFDPAETAET